MTDFLSQNAFNKIGVNAAHEIFEYLDKSKRECAANFAAVIYKNWYDTENFEKEVALLTAQWKAASFHLASLKSLSEFFTVVKNSLTKEQKVIWKNGFYNMVLRSFFDATGLATELPCVTDGRGFAAKETVVSDKPANLKTSSKGASLDETPKEPMIETRESRDMSLAKSAIALLNAPRKVQGNTMTSEAVIEMAINAYSPLDAGAKNELITALRAMCEAMPHLIKAA